MRPFALDALPSRGLAGLGGKVRCGTRPEAGAEEGRQERGVIGGECQGLLSGFGHSHTSAHRVYLVWAQEGSELLTVGAFKGEQRGLGRGREKTEVGKVEQPFRSLSLSL